LCRQPHRLALLASSTGPRPIPSNGSGSSSMITSRAITSTHHLVSHGRCRAVPPGSTPSRVLRSLPFRSCMTPASGRVRANLVSNRIPLAPSQHHTLWALLQRSDELLEPGLKLRVVFVCALEISDHPISHGLGDVCVRWLPSCEYVAIEPDRDQV
jgi:hypothetical protein